MHGLKIRAPCDIRTRVVEPLDDVAMNHALEAHMSRVGFVREQKMLRFDQKLAQHARAYSMSGTTETIKVKKPRSNIKSKGLHRLR